MEYNIVQQSQLSTEKCFKWQLTKMTKKQKQTKKQPFLCQKVEMWWVSIMHVFLFGQCQVSVTLKIKVTHPQTYIYLQPFTRILEEKQKHIASGSWCWQSTLLQMLTSVFKRHRKTCPGGGITWDGEVDSSLWSINSASDFWLFFFFFLAETVIH